MRFFQSAKLFPTQTGAQSCVVVHGRGSESMAASVMMLGTAFPMKNA